MKLLELQKVLGERIELAKDTKLSDEQRKLETERSEIIVRLAKQMINNADVILRTDKLREEYKLTGSNIDKVVG